jgi:hypothetical protein
MLEYNVPQFKKLNRLIQAYLIVNRPDPLNQHWSTAWDYLKGSAMRDFLKVRQKSHNSYEECLELNILIVERHTGRKK